MTFAEKSKELREEFGITQTQLANALKLSRSCISMIEIGRNEPTASTLIAYANYFNLPIDELLSRDEFTVEERAAGLSETRKEKITPLEDDMLYAFRAVGKKLGEKGQRALIDVAEGMAGIK